jgi:hypothetical protein
MGELSYVLSCEAENLINNAVVLMTWHTKQLRLEFRFENRMPYGQKRRTY